MLRLIIIASLLFSNAVLAAPNFIGGKARLKKILACETSMASRLSEGHQELLQRLKFLFDKYDLITSTTPDFVVANMGISVTAFYAEMTSLAGQILEAREPRSVQQLDAILTDLENQVSLGLQVRTRNPRGDISEDKRRMETRHFEDDWSYLDRRASRSSESPQTPLPSKPANLVDEPSYSGHTDDFAFGGFRPNWPPRDKK